MKRAQGCVCAVSAAACSLHWSSSNCCCCCCCCCTTTVTLLMFVVVANSVHVFRTHVHGIVVCLSPRPLSCLQRLKSPYTSFFASVNTKTTQRSGGGNSRRDESYAVHVALIFVIFFKDGYSTTTTTVVWQNQETFHETKASRTLTLSY